MGQPTVYLAGPISGLDYEGATDWRDYAIRELARAGIKGLSPMRAKEYLKGVQEFTKACVDEGTYGALSSPRAIMTRDYWDATRCDVLLVNLLGAKSVSIGTVLEIGFAYSKRVPIIAAIEDQGNVHEHAMIDQAIGVRFTTLNDALHAVKAFIDA